MHGPVAGPLICFCFRYGTISKAVVRIFLFPVPDIISNQMSYFGQGTSSSPRIILIFLAPCPQLGVVEGSRHQTVFNFIDGRFKCEECDEKFISGEDLVNHWVKLHRDADIVGYNNEPHAEVSPAGKVQEIGPEALVIGIDPGILLDGSLNVESLFEADAYIALELDLASHESENKLLKIDPDFETIIENKEFVTDKVLDFACNWSDCDKTFTKKKNLQTHETIHLNPKNCSYCNKAFPSNSKRYIHEVSHTNEKSVDRYQKLNPDFETIMTKQELAYVKNLQVLFPCNWPECGKSFPKLKTLMGHKIVHVNPKYCSYCKKQFPSNSKVRRHEALHDSEKFKINIQKLEPETSWTKEDPLSNT